jgi:hypothetical protein
MSDGESAGGRRVEGSGFRAWLRGRVEGLGFWKGLRWRLGLYRVRLHKEKAGVFCVFPCWVIFHGPWMYGPCLTWQEVVVVMLTEWRSDWHLVG